MVGWVYATLMCPYIIHHQSNPKFIHAFYQHLKSVGDIKMQQGSIQPKKQLGEKQ